MKKFRLKTRMQWGWFKSALLGTAIGLLIAPAAGDLTRGNDLKNPLVTWVEQISAREKVKVMINGETVALAGSRKEGEDAYKAARLAYNADGVKVLDTEVQYEAVDKEQDDVRNMKVLGEPELTETIKNSFSKFAKEDKELAYTMRINDYTVTVEHLQDLISILEQVQNTYDTDEAFQVGLKPPASRNVTMYEVAVNKKENDGELKDTQSDMAQGDSDEEPGIVAEEVVQESATDDNAAQGDGIKYIGFSEAIQVMETYVNTNQVKDRETAYSELTAKNDQPSIYEVQPGDCLSIIAEKTGLSEQQIKELNPGIESDADIYYDDRLNVTVPEAPVQVLVEKQETYSEQYDEDVVYEDDDSMFIGETKVVQEGTPGTHIVTDLVTYKDDLECDRKQLQETVEVAAVAEVVKRGTKSKPTYMYPVTNWSITSNYGYRWGRLHAGVDVGVQLGTTVRAARSGQVVTAGWLGGYGNCVIIDHGDGICTRYGHLSEVKVSAGQYVEQGDQIALSGNTGRSTGPHLHFEIRVNGEAVDPLPYLQ